MKASRAAFTCLLFVVAGTMPVAAQGWRLRFDANAQRVSFRGVTPDSVLTGDVIRSDSAGPVTRDGFAATCGFDAWCRFYRPGDIRSGIPASVGLDLSMWGLGITGLSIRMNGRTMGDLSGDRLWPGTTPALRLVEGYAEYLRGGLTARAGRLLQLGRLAASGSSGLDGIRGSFRTSNDRLEFGAYAGWGLARGTILPITSPAVNPLLDFQPESRQIVVGVTSGFHLPRFDAEVEYRRELDPMTNYIVAERAGFSAQFRPLGRVRIVTGADYDIAQGRVGSADATIGYSGKRVWATLGAKHYRPYFDLWTVWGVFSAVPYDGAIATLAVTPISRLQLRGRGEWFRYQDAEANTPAVPLKDRGYRWGLEATLTPLPAWTVELGGHGELQPGASSSGIDGRVVWRARERVDLSLNGGSLERPLELRFQDAGVRWAGAALDYHVGDRWRAGVSADRYWESRDRPDALAFDWNQWRLSARVSVTLKSSADRWLLPPASRAP
ncbi:MAG: hypothetical protein ABIZ70_03015 [Gemmatimonadales bacterium]